MKNKRSGRMNAAVKSGLLIAAWLLVLCMTFLCACAKEEPDGTDGGEKGGKPSGKNEEINEKETDVTAYAEGKYALYEKDGLPYYHDFEDQTAWRFSDVKIVSSSLNMTKDASKLTFIEEDGNLCYREIRDKTKERVVLDNDVLNYLVNENGDVCFYVKRGEETSQEEQNKYLTTVSPLIRQYGLEKNYLGKDWQYVSKQHLIRYCLDTGEKEEITYGFIGGFSVSRSGNETYFLTFDSDVFDVCLWQWSFDKGLQRIAKGILTWQTFDEGRSVCYKTADDVLWRKENGKDPVEITADCRNILALSDKGEIYYVIDSDKVKYIYPRVLTEEEYNYWINRIAELDLASREDVKMLFKKYDITNPRRADDVEELKSKYPLYETEIIYVARDANKRMNQELAELFSEAGYTLEDFQKERERVADRIEDGYLDIYYHDGTNKLVCEGVSEYYCTEGENGKSKMSSFPVVAYLDFEEKPVLSISGRNVTLKEKAFLDDHGKVKIWFKPDDEKKQVYFYVRNEKEELDVYCADVDKDGECRLAASAVDDNNAVIASTGSDGLYYVKKGDFYRGDTQIMSGDGSQFNYARSDYDGEHRGHGVFYSHKRETSDVGTHKQTVFHFCREEDPDQSITIAIRGFDDFVLYRSGILCYLQNNEEGKGELLAWVDGEPIQIDQEVSAIMRDKPLSRYCDLSDFR